MDDQTYDDQPVTDDAGAAPERQARGPAESAPAPRPAAPAVMPPEAYRRGPNEKTPLLAAILSFVPGLGNIYNGLYSRGISFAVTFVFLVVLASAAQRDQEIAMIVPTMIFFVLFNVFDAYRQATLINLGYAADEGTGRRVRTESGGLLVPGILLTLIGAFAVLDRYFGIYAWEVLEHWPIPALVLGVYLIFRSIQAGRPRPGYGE